MNVLLYGDDTVDSSPWYGFQVIDYKREAVLDTGTSLLGLPPLVFNTVLEKIS